MSAFGETWLGASGTTPRSKTLRGTSTWLKNMFRPYDYRKHRVFVSAGMIKERREWPSPTFVLNRDRLCNTMFCSLRRSQNVFLLRIHSSVSVCVCFLWVRQNEPGQHTDASFVSVQNCPAYVEARVPVTSARIYFTFRRRVFKYRCKYRFPRWCGSL